MSWGFQINKIIKNQIGASLLLVSFCVFGCKGATEGARSGARFQAALKDGPGFLAKAQDGLYSFDTPTNNRSNVIEFEGGLAPYRFEFESCAAAKSFSVKASQSTLIVSSSAASECRMRVFDSKGGEIELALFSARPINGRSAPIHREAAAPRSVAGSLMSSQSSASSAPSSSESSSALSSVAVVSSSTGFSSADLSSVPMSVSAVSSSSASSTLSSVVQSSSVQSSLLPSPIALNSFSLSSVSQSSSLSSSSSSQCEMKTDRRLKYRWRTYFHPTLKRIAHCPNVKRTAQERLAGKDVLDDRDNDDRASANGIEFEDFSLKSCSEANIVFLAHRSLVDSACNIPVIQFPTDCVQLFRYNNPGVYIDPIHVIERSADLKCGPSKKDPVMLQVIKDLDCEYIGPAACK